MGENPEKAQFKFRARNRWIDGSLSEATIDTFHALGEEQSRPQAHIVQADQPALILGQDLAPNPVENLLAALSSCIATTTVYHAAASGETVETLSSELEGAIDVQGFMGIDPEVREGFNAITVKVKARSFGQSAASDGTHFQVTSFGYLAQWHPRGCSARNDRLGFLGDPWSKNCSTLTPASCPVTNLELVEKEPVEGLTPPKIKFRSK